MSKTEIKASLEALLFMALDPISLDELSKAVGFSRQKVKESLEAIQTEYEAVGKGIELVKIGKGYQFQTKSSYQGLVKQFHDPKTDKRLSQAALETLAIIAYKQPVTRPEVEEIRGVNVEKALKTLRKRGLVEQTGQKDTIGCPNLYGTTDKFLKYMGLSSLQELPPPEEFSAESLDQPEEISRKEAVS